MTKYCFKNEGIFEMRRQNKAFFKGLFNIPLRSKSPNPFAFIHVFATPLEKNPFTQTCLAKGSHFWRRSAKGSHFCADRSQNFERVHTFGVTGGDAQQGPAKGSHFWACPPKGSDFCMSSQKLAKGSHFWNTLPKYRKGSDSCACFSFPSVPRRPKTLQA